MANLQCNDILKQIIREESSITFQVIQAKLKPYAHGLNQYLAVLFVWKDIFKDKIHKSYHRTLLTDKHLQLFLC